MKKSYEIMGSHCHSLQADCERCFGLCCVALYFAASEGFPTDKEAGKPCINLQQDFSCCVHENLVKLGLKGCTSFDCFGAGQKVSQITFNGQNWRKASKIAEQMFSAFQIMRQLHELLWYLTEALTLQPACSIHQELRSLVDETQRLTHLSSDFLLKLDVSVHRKNVDNFLQKTSDFVRAEARREQNITSKRYKTMGKRLDLIGQDLRSFDLRGENFRGAYLIAADLKGVDLAGTDFIGADLRDADIRGADLHRSIFLTQAQINTAKGDNNTKLPLSLTRPTYWIA